MMMLNVTQISFLSYFYTFCTLYVLLKIGLQVWSLFSQYIVPRLKKPHDYTKYGRWAVVTGCTDGIGKGFAKGLASKGVDVCLISRNEEKLKNTAKEIEESYNVRTKYIVADFTDTTVYTHIRESLSDTDIGILVNNVGISDRIEPFRDIGEQLIRDYHNVNMLSLTMMTSIVLPCMHRKKRGLIINMSSTTGEVNLPNLSIYCGSKAFITTFGTCLSYEAKKDNIHVVTLIPGLIHTPLLYRFSGVAQFCDRFLPFSILSVPNFINEALLTISSGCYKTCGYFGFDCLLALFKLAPVELPTHLGSIINKMNNSKEELNVHIFYNIFIKYIYDASSKLCLVFGILPFLYSLYYFVYKI